MRPPADYHMHTPLCRHASGAPAEYARQALAAGLQEIGFSDHSPMRRDDFDDWRMRLDQLDEYVEMIRKTQRDFPQLDILLALEVDYLPEQEDWVHELSARHAWDYLIGSVHYVSEDWAVDNPNQMARWRKSDVYEIWSAYFDRLRMAAETGCFEIIGHADLPKKFGFRPERDCTSLYQAFLKAAATQQCAIELNTAGLRKECHEIYPHPAILRLAYQAGVPITFGSDAHAPEQVGMNFAEAVELARSAGYSHRRRFRARRPATVELEQ